MPPKRNATLQRSVHGFIKRVIFNKEVAQTGEAPQGDVEPTAPPGATPPAEPREAPKDRGEKKSRVQELSEENNRRRLENKQLRAGQKTLEEKMAQIEADRLQAWREAAAARFGIPPELATRLQGESKADIEKDAEAVAKLLPQPQTQPAKPSHSPANPGGGAAGLTIEEIKGMTPQEVAARWKEVEPVLKSK